MRTAPGAAGRAHAQSSARSSPHACGPAVPSRTFNRSSERRPDRMEFAKRLQPAPLVSNPSREFECGF
jgi:hypothetical protein